MLDKYVRKVFVVSFECSSEGVADAARFVRDVVPIVYRTHRHLVHGFFLSRHRNLYRDSPYNNVWLCYRVLAEPANDHEPTIARDLTVIATAHSCARAAWMNAGDKDEHFRGSESEQEAFREIPEWHGLTFLPTLWAECEFATLQAYCILTNNVCPEFLHPWSRHILENGLEP